MQLVTRGTCTRTLKIKSHVMLKEFYNLNTEAMRKRNRVGWVKRK